MEFKINDKVCLQVDKTFSDGKNISANSGGIICDIYEIFNAYLVKFEGIGLPRMISEDELQSYP